MGRKMEALTTRERQVLHLVADGLSDSEIAERLCLNKNTVCWHVQNMEDAGCPSRYDR
ncbi:MAG: helix-turn-helix transcriptional regulator [Anaerolineae bacterium]|nr:helix-turn-helix transcriptional regulator [Anaerolineae bacterium]